MHPATNSIKYFGLYAIATGVGLALVPGLVLAPLGIPAPAESWIRVVGALAIPLGYYYWVCGTSGAVAFFRATIPGRLIFVATMVLLITAFGAPKQLLLFAAIDLAGAAWTYIGLRKAASAGA